MLASLLTTVFFSLSVITAARSSRIVGGATANLSRMTLAAVLLAVWAHAFGGGLGGAGLPWFFLSGVIGFGLGDMALFASIERIGPRLTILLTQCLAAPIAALAEWLWLGTTLHTSEVLCSAVILAGVAFALAPDRSFEGGRATFWIGVACGVGSAAGQALGAVTSRKANDVAALAGSLVDGGTAAYQRILAGITVTALAYIFFKRMRPQPGTLGAAEWRRASPLIVANALSGPALGVACYQWALRTTPSGIVLPIVATSPLVTMLLTWLIDRERPTRRATVGGVLAVIGAAGLKYFSEAK
ncbi:MAG: DMT family transporter [Chthoniobacteraceae bacterium]